MVYLLERLERVGGDIGFDLEAAVGAQIARLVAVHDWELPAGLAESLGLGLPSAVDLGRNGAGDLESYAARLQQVIHRHEPRLRDARVLVHPAADHQPPYLVVRATLAAEQGPKPFYFTLPGG